MGTLAPRTLRPFVVTLTLLTLTSLALAYSVDVAIADQPGVRMQLPAKVGGWQGDEVRFCQQQKCQQQWFVSQLTNRDVCAKCEGRLSGLSKIEVDILPPDTEGLKQRYRTAEGRNLMVSIVLSGRERASIHRPEVCLDGQGNTITSSHVIDVPMQGHPPIQVKILELEHKLQGIGSDGQPAKFRSYYAYWFVGHGRETPSHWQRMAWMATDRIFRNVAHRWAYIAVAGVREGTDRSYEREVTDFIGQLYPQITLN